jgi:hypothetical protein
MNTFVGVPQPDSPHKPLPTLVDSARVGARTSHGAAFFGSVAGTCTSVGGRKRCGALVTDPPAEAVHDRTHERGALIGRKDRDRVDVRADEDEESHDDALWG